VQRAVVVGVTGAADLTDLVGKLKPPRVAWVMVPAGKPTENTIEQLTGAMQPGDVVIDGGNSNFHDSMAHARKLAARQIEFVDAGTSGGIWGLKNGYCLMIGASPKAFATCEPIFKSLAPPDGYAHVG